MNNRIKKCYPESIKVDDYISRIEILLNEYRFINFNTIAMMNICRDESTNGLQEMIEQIFGISFKMTGLGGVITCGKTGLMAGLSHAPISNELNTREKYLFFSYPHIAIHPTCIENNGLGMVMRSGQLNPSFACGALVKCLNELKIEGIECNIKTAGVHEPDDVEYSILKQRLARIIHKKNIDINKVDISLFTLLAEEQITNDLEILISKTVDISKADYAVFTGIQIHSWDNPDNYWTNEYILPKTSYIVINGDRYNLDVNNVKKLSYRQLSKLFIK